MQEVWIITVCVGQTSAMRQMRKSILIMSWYSGYRYFWDCSGTEYTFDKTETSLEKQFAIIHSVE